MDFAIEAAQLRRGLARTAEVISRKTTVPILANVLIEATESEVIITGFDLEIAVVSRHPAEVKTPGKVTMQAEIISKFADLSSDGRIRVRRAPNNYVKLTSGASEFSIVGMSAEEYPRIPKEDDAAFLPISGTAMLELLKRTMFAMSGDETRYMLNGVFFEQEKGGKVRAVATDGHRMSVADAAVGEKFEVRKGGVIIPRKGISALKKLLEEAPEAGGELAITESNVLLRREGIYMLARRIDAQFPEYQRVVPKPSPAVRIRREPLVNLLKRLTVIDSDKSNGLVFSVDASKKMMSVRAHNSDLGEASDELTVESGKDVDDRRFNPWYVLDVLAVMVTEEVDFEFGDDHTMPLRVTEVGNENFQSVIMPMKL